MDDLKELERLEELANGLDVSNSEESDNYSDDDEDGEITINSADVSIGKEPADNPSAVKADSSQLLESAVLLTEARTVDKSDTENKQTLTELFLSIDKVVRFDEEISENEEDEQEEEAGLAALAEGDAEQSESKEDENELEYQTPDDPDCKQIEEQIDKSRADESTEEGDSEEGSEDEDDLEEFLPNEENLEILNMNYKDYLNNVLMRLNRELQSNLTRQREIERLLEEKEGELRQSAKPYSSQHAAVIKKSLVVFGYPYFKDAQMYHPPPNADTVKKQNSHELDVWVDYPRAWTREERNQLVKAVRTQANEKRLWKYFDEKEELERAKKKIGIRQEEVDKLDERCRAVNFSLREIPDEKLFHDRFEDFDWMKISAQEFKMTHSPLDCALQWKNLAHVSINRSAWTAEEDRMLKTLADATGGFEWDAIATEMETGRTAIACYTRFMQKHNKVSCNRSWRSKEDDKLRRLVAHSRVHNYIPWAKVNYYMERRSKEQCYQRYTYSLKETIRHGFWTDAEEWILILGELLYGKDWSRTADLLSTRTITQASNHWNNYLKAEFKPWTTEEDFLLLESVKKFGLRNWVAVASVFNDDSRNRARCRQRFHGIFRVFKTHQNKAIENLDSLETNKTAAKRRQHAFSSLENKFNDWILKMDEEPVVSNIPVAAVDLDSDVTLPNGSVVKTRIVSKFLRHLQTLLPVVKAKPLEPLPPPRLRIFPDEDIEPPHLRPLKFDKLARKRKPVTGPCKRRKAPRKVEHRDTTQSKKTGQVSAMDRQITKLFRPTYFTRLGRYTVQHSAEELGLLNATARNLNEVLDLSGLQSNPDHPKLNMFSKAELQVLEHYLMHSDITECSVNRLSRKSISYSDRLTYGRRKMSEDSEPNELLEDGKNLLMPNHRSLMTFRGLLLHADHTAELVNSNVSIKQTAGNPQRVARMGINNTEIMRRSSVGQKLFTPLHQVKEDEIPATREAQVSADKKLVDRFIKLFFLPAMMSVSSPSNIRSLFLDDEETSCTEERISAVSPFITEETMPCISGAQSINHSVPILDSTNIPSVISVYSSPATPITRTYTRKRPAKNLGLNFSDLVSSTKKRRPGENDAAQNSQTSVDPSSCMSLCQSGDGRESSGELTKSNIE